jgi:hypothetical protein
MEEIAKIFKINKTGIMQTFIILIICSVAGNIIHDVIMLMENIGLVEKDYTVFPMGSFMVIIGIIATVIFAATTYNYTRFNMDVSYGCTNSIILITFLEHVITGIVFDTSLPSSLTPYSR